jgi:hypothetical protein
MSFAHGYFTAKIEDRGRNNVKNLYFLLGTSQLPLQYTIAGSDANGRGLGDVSKDFLLYFHQKEYCGYIVLLSQEEHLPM